MPELLDGPKMRTVVFLPAGLKGAANDLAGQLGVSFGEVVRQALNRWVGTLPAETDDASNDPRLVPCAPFATPRGTLCGLCDSTSGCSHPQLRCWVCGSVGLAENMPGHDCPVETTKSAQRVDAEFSVIEAYRAKHRGEVRCGVCQQDILNHSGVQCDRCKKTIGFCCQAAEHGTVCVDCSTEPAG